MQADLYHNLKPINQIAPVAVTATATATGIDTTGYQSVMFVVSVGVITAADASNYLTFTVEESDSLSTGYAAITDTNRLLGTPTVIEGVAVLAASQNWFGITRLQKKYIRLVATETGTFSAIVSAIAILGNPRHAPTV